MEEKNLLAELVTELQQGNGEAFEKIYNLTSGKAFATALSIVKNRDDAEDLLQDAYVTVLDKIDSLEKPEAFQGWFNIIVANKAKSFLQKSQPVLFKDDDEEAAAIDSIKDDKEEYKPGLDVEKEELRKDVMALINNLSDDKRTVILLYYYNEMSIKEIAQALEINENTVKSRLLQAKKDLSKGIKALEKKDKKLFGIAPGPVIIWALRSTSDSAAASFVGSAASAGVLGSVTAASGAGTAAAVGSAAGGIAAKFAALTLLQKVVAGVVAASVIAGIAVGTKKIVDYRKSSAASASVTVTFADLQNEKTSEINTAEFPESTESADEKSEQNELTEKSAEKTSEKSSENKKTSKKEKSTTEKSSSLHEKEATEKSTSATATTEPPQTTTSSTAKSETTTASTTKKTTTTTRRTTTTTKRTTTTTKRTTTTTKRTTTTTKRTTTTTKRTTTTTKPTTTTTTTTTKAPATIKINYVVTDGSGDESPATKTVPAGSTITESDITGGMISKYDNVVIRSGTYPVTAESGNTYEYTVYLWNY